MYNKKNLIFCILLCLLTIILDQASKWVILSYLDFNSSINIFTGFNLVVSFFCDVLTDATSFEETLVGCFHYSIKRNQCIPVNLMNPLHCISHFISNFSIFQSFVTACKKHFATLFRHVCQNGSIR